MKKKAVLGLAFLLAILIGCTPVAQGPVAIVNGVEISRADYDRELEYELASFTQAGYKLSEEELRIVQESVLERLINNCLLLGAAEAAGITRESVDVEGTLEKIISNYEDEAQFQADLKENGFTLEEFRDLIAEALIIEDLFEAELKLSAVEVSEEVIDALVEEYLATLDEDEDVEQLDMEAVRSYFAYALAQEKANAMRMDYIEELREQSEIEYLDFLS